MRSVNRKGESGFFLAKWLLVLTIFILFSLLTIYLPYFDEYSSTFKTLSSLALTLFGVFGIRLTWRNKSVRRLSVANLVDHFWFRQSVYLCFSFFTIVSVYLLLRDFEFRAINIVLPDNLVAKVTYWPENNPKNKKERRIQGSDELSVSTGIYALTIQPEQSNLLPDSKPVTVGIWDVSVPAVFDNFNKQPGFLQVESNLEIFNLEILKPSNRASVYSAMRQPGSENILLLPGDYELFASASGYKNIGPKRFSIVSNNLTPLARLQFEPIDRFVDINSNPEQMRIVITDIESGKSKDYGNTPKKILLEPKRYQVRLTKRHPRSQQFGFYHSQVCDLTRRALCEVNPVLTATKLFPFELVPANSQLEEQYLLKGQGMQRYLTLRGQPQVFYEFEGVFNIYNEKNHDRPIARLSLKKGEMKPRINLE